MWVGPRAPSMAGPTEAKRAAMWVGPRAPSMAGPKVDPWAVRVVANWGDSKAAQTAVWKAPTWADHWAGHWALRWVDHLVPKSADRWVVRSVLK